jgi:hypothetical protein
MLARTRVRLTTKIRLKLNSYPHSHFTDQLVGVFRKQPFKSDLN